MNSVHLVTQEKYRVKNQVKKLSQMHKHPTGQAGHPGTPKCAHSGRIVALGPAVSWPGPAVSQRQAAVSQRSPARPCAPCRSACEPAPAARPSPAHARTPARPARPPAPSVCLPPARLPSVHCAVSQRSMAVSWPSAACAPCRAVA